MVKVCKRQLERNCPLSPSLSPASWGEREKNSPSPKGWLPKAGGVVKDILFHITPRLLTQSPLSEKGI